LMHDTRTAKEVMNLSLGRYGPEDKHPYPDPSPWPKMASAGVSGVLSLSRFIFLLPHLLPH